MYDNAIRYSSYYQDQLQELVETALASNSLVIETDLLTTIKYYKKNYEAYTLFCLVWYLFDTAI